MSLLTLSRWKKFRYTLYSPLYDFIGRLFMNQREMSVKLADIKERDKILIIGAGTRLDLHFLPEKCSIVAVDISTGMLNKLRHRAFRLQKDIDIMVMDGEALSFEDNTFDVILLHMILAVIEDAEKCLNEAERVLKKGGRIMVFDKFLPDDQKATLFRRIVNPVADLIASDLNRKAAEIVKKTKLVKLYDQPAGWNGLLRIIKLQKN